MASCPTAKKSGEVQRVYKLKMSRGESEDTDIDLERIEDYVVFDDRDNALRFGDIYKLKKTIVLFMRHPQCFTVKEYMDDLMKVTPEMLEDANVQLAVFFPVKSELLFTIKSEFMFPHKLYCDPERGLFKELGFTAKAAGKSNLSTSKHVKSGLMSGVLQSTYRAMWYQDFMADMHQNGGCLIVGPGRLLHHCHKDNGMFDHIAINRILELVGAPVLSFPKDQRVITV